MLKEYQITFSWNTKITFPIIKAHSKEKAIELAEIDLVSNFKLEEKSEEGKFKVVIVS